MAVTTLFTVVRRRWAIALSLLLVVAGIAALTAPSVYYWYQREAGKRTNTATARQVATKVAKADMNLGVPTELRVPRLNIDLQIIPGKYTQSSQNWSLDRTHAFYILPGTAPLHDNVPPLIYGHDIPAVFKPLNGMAPGEILLVKNTAGKTLLFEYVNDTIVKPEQGDQLNAATGKNTLNMLTCTGRMFTERRIMHFNYVGEMRADGAIV